MNAGNVGMIQRGEEPRFPLEAGEPIGVRRERSRQDLEGHVATELLVAGAIHLPHSTFAKQPADSVHTKTRARG
jgi:hypothetical protein